MSEDQADYITDALEMIGMNKPKEIVQTVSGFVPVFEALLEKYDDHITALVFGRRWQYCRMKDGVCNASLDTIAKDLKISTATVLRHTEKLVEDGYLIDLTPDLRNTPHTYADAGRVVMKSQLTAQSISQRNVSISQRNATVSQSQLIKDINKQDKKAAPPLSEKDHQQVNAKVDAIIANTARADWQGREIFLPDHLPLMDWYHTATGQDCPKAKRKDWMKAAGDWAANNLTVPDLQAAHDMDLKWRGVFTSPNQLTDKAIALRAQKQARPEIKREVIRYDPEEEKRYVPNPNPRSRPRTAGV